ncbi:MAG: hypothetical protein ACJ8AW_36310 [Rhodopila sp.]
MRCFITVLAAVAFAVSSVSARAEYIASNTFPTSYEPMGGNAHIADTAIGMVTSMAASGDRLIKATGAVWAFCVDINDWAMASGSYSFAPVTLSDLARTYASAFSKIAAINAVLQFPADVYGSFPGSQSLGNSAQRNEAAQLAIWPDRVRHKPCADPGRQRYQRHRQLRP